MSPSAVVSDGPAVALRSRPDHGARALRAADLAQGLRSTGLESPALHFGGFTAPPPHLGALAY